MNPLQAILAEFGILILDGPLATELERRGCDLNDPLWSARVLLENPALIRAVHEEYLKAGADCLITASYQASFAGFMRRGFSAAEADAYMRSSVALAIRARDDFWANTVHRHNRPRPLVAASIGPYGACLADGSEYRGDYGLDVRQLMSFHRPRLQSLLAAGPDLLACETLPCLEEAKALVQLINEYPASCCWMSFSARDGLHISNGERIRDCARWLDGQRQVAALGVNCTPPAYISSLIAEIRKETEKPIVIYPNSGERYEANTRLWREGSPAPGQLSELARGWFAQGARLLGGCCRTTPADIRAIAGWARKQ